MPTLSSEEAVVLWLMVLYSGAPFLGCTAVTPIEGRFLKVCAEIENSLALNHQYARKGAVG